MRHVRDFNHGFKASANGTASPRFLNLTKLNQILQKGLKQSSRHFSLVLATHILPPSEATFQRPTRLHEPISFGPSLRLCDQFPGEGVPPTARSDLCTAKDGACTHSQCSAPASGFEVSSCAYGTCLKPQHCQHVRKPRHLIICNGDTQRISTFELSHRLNSPGKLPFSVLLNHGI